MMELYKVVQSGDDWCSVTNPNSFTLELRAHNSNYNLMHNNSMPWSKADCKPWNKQTIKPIQILKTWDFPPCTHYTNSHFSWFDAIIILHQRSNVVRYVLKQFREKPLLNMIEHIIGNQQLTRLNLDYTSFTSRGIATLWTHRIMKHNVEQQRAACWRVAQWSAPCVQ